MITPAAPRRLLFLALPTMLLAITCTVYRPPFYARLDDAAYDAVVRSTPAVAPAGRIAIVDVDERSLAAVGQWPWRRDVMGRLIRALRAAGATVIGIDVIFAESDRHDESGVADSDRALARVVSETGPVLGYGLTFDSGGPAARACALRPLPIAVVRPPHEEGADPFFHATGAVCNLPVLASAAPRSGFLNAAPDRDGILRRAPLVVELDGHLYPSFALSVYSAIADVSHPELAVSTVNASTLRIGSAAVPLDARGSLLLAFRGGKRTFPYVSAVDALNGTAGDALRGRIVLVGTTALGTREVVATPLDTQFVGVEVQATAIDNLLQHDFVHRSRFGASIDAAIVVLACGAVAALAAGAGVTASVSGAAVLIGLSWWGSVWLLTSARLFVSPLAPVAGVLLTLAVMTFARFTVERGRATRAGREKTAAQQLMVQTLLSLTEVRDAETGRHSLRTQQYARLLAGELAAHPRFRDYLTAERVELLSQLAPLHDIGKVGIPDRILTKPGRLTHEETAEMRRHPELGLDVIVRAESRVGVHDNATLQMAKDIVYTHHERWDGAGYPRGLRGTDIPVPGRIMAVVDVYDAVHARSLYMPSLPHVETVTLIERGRATHFDPDVVDAFLRVADRFAAISAGDPVSAGEPRPAA